MQKTGSLFQSGFILLDKPRGPSSHEATSFIKKLLGAKKCGHAGTLDPNVSGVLVIAINKATKLLRYISSSQKCYICTMRSRKEPPSLASVQAQMDNFVGKIRQIPPLHSAVAKRRRTRQVFELKALELNGKNILFFSRVEAGTYIRTLCIDIGEAFGGGKMLELRRTSAGNISEGMLCTIPQLADAVYVYEKFDDELPIRSLIKPAGQMIILPSIVVGERFVDAVCRGAPLALSGVASVEGSFAKGSDIKFVSGSGELIAAGKAAMDSSEIQACKYGQKIVALPKAVLAEPAKKRIQAEKKKR